MTKTTAWRIALVVMVIGLFVVQYQQVRLLERIAIAMAGDVASKALTTSWKSPAAITASNPEGVVTVVTKKEVGESDAALVVRHTADVQAKLADFPLP